MKMKLYSVFQKQIKMFIEKNSYLFSELCLFNMPGIIQFYLNLHDKISDGYILHIITILLILSMIACNFIICMILNKLPRCMTLVYLFFSGIIFFTDIFLLHKYHNVLDEAIVQLLLDTNFSESYEFIENNIASIIVLIVLGILLSVVLYKILWKVRIITNIRFFSCIFLLSFEASISLFLFNIFPNNLIYESSLVRTISNTYRSIQEINEYKSVYNQFDGQVIQLTKNNAIIPNVVFILGESTSKNHMGIYGYNVDNTPLLDKREEKGEIIKFSDVVSPQSETMLVAERLFTFYRNGDDDKWFNHTNLFDILNKAGYHTNWLSNQESSGVYGGVTRCYADRCSEKSFVEMRDSNSHAVEFDEKLLPILDDSLKNYYGKNFYVLHLMGTHFDYAKRYPKEYERFYAKDESGENEIQKKKRSEYDNAVLYNDFILDEIIKRFEDKDAIIIYVSDHGEEIYDGRDYSGHYRIGSLYQIEIPMLIWTSSKFRENHEGTMSKINQAKDRPFMTDDMIHAILDLMKIETPEYDPSKSLFNEKFDASRQRVYNGIVYKKDWKINTQAE